MEVKITDNTPSKLTGLNKASLPDVFPATITLNVEDYAPDYVELRTRISSCIITANVSHDVLERLETDPLVKSVTAGEVMKPI
jgi:hypothetical protein